ncbi:MAG: HK97 family phage prohead protease [Dehalococcoidales bacterium]|nr:HK97 family phage prohead protease [Dehalococcoidales bacterium]
MTETIFKTFRPEVKAVNSEDGTIDMLIPMSTASTDRDGESIDPLGWRKSLPAFRKRPVLLSSHNYGDLRKQIGEFTKLKVSEDGLFASPRYYINEGNEEADWAFKLASKGMAAYSVGFIPKAWTDGDGEKEPRRTYTEQELLEISHVVVPSNRDAIQGLRGKSVDPVLNSVIDDIVSAEIIDLTTKPEDTGETIRIPVDDGNHEGHERKTIPISKKEGIQALYCVDDKKILTYLFDKAAGWTMEKAKAWVKEHEKSVNLICTMSGEVIGGVVFEPPVTLPVEDIPAPAKHSQKEIMDEIDFVKSLIAEYGMNKETNAQAWDLVREIMRENGSDIPADIKFGVTQISLEPPPTKTIDDRINIIIEQTVSHFIK